MERGALWLGKDEGALSSWGGVGAEVVRPGAMLTFPLVLLFCEV